MLGPYVEGLSQLCVLDAQEIEDLMIGEKITSEYFHSQCYPELIQKLVIKGF